MKIPEWCAYCEQPPLIVRIPSGLLVGCVRHELCRRATVARMTEWANRVLSGR